MTTADDKGSLHKRLRRQITGREHDFFAVVHPGFESAAAGEIGSQCGGPSRIVPGGVEFRGKLDLCYLVNLRCRTVTRVLMRVAEFRARRFAKLRDLAGDIPWELYLNSGVPVAFSATSHGSRLFHTGRIVTEFRRAIASRLGDGTFFAEGSECANEIHTVFIRFDDDLCTVSIDSSGESLYRRGYKLHVEDAPLRETLAASLLIEADIGNCDLLVDPMAGSGTFSLEAGHMALGIAPGISRSFAFEKWPAASAAALRHLAKRLESSVIPPEKSPLKIICADADERAVATARRNAERAGLGALVNPVQADFLTADFFAPPGAKTLVALNPPYGKRLGNAGEALELYKKIGERLRNAYPRAGLVIIAPGKRFEKALGPGFDRKIGFSHGGIPVSALIRLPRP